MNKEQFQSLAITIGVPYDRSRILAEITKNRELHPDDHANVLNSALHISGLSESIRFLENLGTQMSMSVTEEGVPIFVCNPSLYGTNLDCHLLNTRRGMGCHFFVMRYIGDRPLMAIMDVESPEGACSFLEKLVEAKHDGIGLDVWVAHWDDVFSSLLN